MDGVAVRQCSLFSTYYEINKFDSLHTGSREDLVFDKDVDLKRSESEVNNVNEETDNLLLMRNLTFYPTPALKFCENCETSEDTLSKTTENLIKDESHNYTIDREPAVAFCQDCQLAMCRRCCKCHGNMKVFREHMVVPVISNNEHFIKKSVRTKQKRHRLNKDAQKCKSAVEFHHTNKDKITVEVRRREKNKVTNTLELEAYAADCQESVTIHKEIDEKVDGLTRRINHLQNKLSLYDQVVEDFCQTMLSTQVSIVETSEQIRRKIELQVDEMLNKLKTGAVKFCSSLEDKKEEIVGAVDELIISRSYLLQQKSKRTFDRAERDKLTFLLQNISNIQSRVMSKNREVGERMDLNFKPLDLTSCCPSIGRLEVFCYESDMESPFSKSAELARVVPFENEVRGITLLRDEVAVVTANCPTVFLLDANSLELVSTHDVKDMKNPYDLVSDKSNVLYITEWSEKTIHRVQLPVRQFSKIVTKNSYTTLSLTPSGFALATCPLKNKAREFDSKKSRFATIHLCRDKDAMAGSACRDGSSSGASSDETNGNSCVRATNGTAIPTGNVCHVVALPNKWSEEGGLKFLLCTSDSHLVLANEKGVPISCYKKSCLNGNAKCSKGNISLSLHKPSHVAVDKEGFVYVCDSGNDRIVLLDIHLNFVKEVLKPGTSGVRCPLRIFLDHERSRLFVAATSLYVFELF